MIQGVCCDRHVGVAALCIAEEVARPFLYERRQQRADQRDDETQKPKRVYDNSIALCHKWLGPQLDGGNDGGDVCSGYELREERNGLGASIRLQRFVALNYKSGDGSCKQAGLTYPL